MSKTHSIGTTPLTDRAGRNHCSKGNGYFIASRPADEEVVRWKDEQGREYRRVPCKTPNKHVTHFVYSFTSKTPPNWRAGLELAQSLQQSGSLQAMRSLPLLPRLGGKILKSAAQASEPVAE